MAMGTHTNSYLHVAVIWSGGHRLHGKSKAVVTASLLAMAWVHCHERLSPRELHTRTFFHIQCIEPA